MTQTLPFRRHEKQRSLVDDIKRRLASELGIGVDVKLAEERTLERFNGKGDRVVDNRKF